MEKENKKKQHVVSKSRAKMYMQKEPASCWRLQGRALFLEPDGGSERFLQPPGELERARQVLLVYSSLFGQLGQEMRHWQEAV